MTNLHSITFEEATGPICKDRTINDWEMVRTGRYHILYLFHDKLHPGLFEIAEQAPSVKGRKTSFQIDKDLILVSYSTDIPIIVQFESRWETILMPNYHGQLVLLRMSEHSLDEQLPNLKLMKIMAFAKNSTFRFLEFSA